MSKKTVNCAEAREFYNKLLNCNTYQSLIAKNELRCDHIAEYLKDNEPECTIKLFISQMLFESIINDDANKTLAWSLVFAHYLGSIPGEKILSDLERSALSWRSQKITES